ncbi:hypothetical protein ACLE20_13360 [Rhizobium sp. YIM 134829]|uniref:hypothetical protein n=1 Tax=Rhizobium sp. YIM 134829 TaxID=3390453 RepID=UPI00397C7AAE
MTTTAAIDPIAYQREAARRHYAQRQPERKPRPRIKPTAAPVAAELPDPPAVEAAPRAFLRRRCSELDTSVDIITGHSVARDVASIRHLLMWEMHCAFPRLSLARLGGIFGRDHTTLISALCKHGYVCKPKVFATDEQREEAYRLLLAGASNRAAGRAVGVSYATIALWIDKYGWELSR